MSEAKYNYWHPVYQPVKPCAMPTGCEYESTDGWRSSKIEPNGWGAESCTRRWPIDQTPPAPKMRAMTAKECVAMASPNGWVFRNKALGVVFTDWTTEMNQAAHVRARIDTLNDDGTGGEWQVFEVEA